jgi:hypothetical protein
VDVACISTTPGKKKKGENKYRQKVYTRKISPGTASRALKMYQAHRVYKSEKASKRYAKENRNNAVISSSIALR